MLLHYVHVICFPLEGAGQNVGYFLALPLAGKSGISYIFFEFSLFHYHKKRNWRKTRLILVGIGKKTLRHFTSRVSHV